MESVLLLEAGDDDRYHDMVGFGSYAHHLIGTVLDWGYQVAGKGALEGREDVSFPCGKVLGGSAAISEGLYQRPPKKELDALSGLGVKGWSYDDCLPYYTRSEMSTIQEENKYHGFSGEMRTGFSTVRSPIGRLSAESAELVGVPKKYDTNSGVSATGVSPAQVMVDKRGKKLTPAGAFVRPILGQKNFTARCNATVTKVIFEGDKAVGVEWTDARGSTHKTLCAKEVILCAGAIGTPSILLQSKVENKAVGKNLQDLATVPVIYQARKGVSYDNDNVHTAAQTLAYNMSGTGPILSFPVDTVMYLDSTAHKVGASYLQKDEDAAKVMKAIAAKGKNSKNADRFVTVTSRGGFNRNEWIRRKLSYNLGKFVEAMSLNITAAETNAPSAEHGEVKVNAKGEIEVDVAFARSEEALAALVPTMRFARRVCMTKPLRNILTAREAIDVTLLETVEPNEATDLMYGKKAQARMRFPRATPKEDWEKLEKLQDDIDTDRYLLAYCKAHARPFGAPVGTCSLAPLNTASKEKIPSAVDPLTLKLRGTQNVRIADCSVLPTPLTAPPAATSMMIGERCAEMILGKADK
eukprot:TRINITY_DN5456_c0_g3_i1.p1 TRINITY_DN5456_c0_g3~~TRINITY_DN5456_c0_g3_i1.p1  ORF type:complete len:683 (+),score=300.38 TRINITY_DN5456_c0_g3_i1:309-2051(+)